MSYLQLASGIPNFTKAVISLWFRVPQVSIDAAQAAFISEFQIAPLFNGIIPLVVMGTEGKRTFEGGAGDEGPTNPTVIGINCDPGQTRPVLYINFETSQEPVVIALGSHDLITGAIGGLNGTNIYLDASGSGADKWHHVLISLDFKTIATHGYGWEDPAPLTVLETVDSAAQLFVALDDVNYTEFDLNDYYVRDSGGHMIVTETAIDIAGARQSTDVIDGELVPITGVPNYTLSDPTIPCSGSPIGLPATPAFVQNIYRVEMAEFQMFTGLTLDTGVESNRRAFVDKAGKPVPSDQKQSRDDNGNIIQDSGSIELLGKRPEILLHGSNNWKAGYNTGSTGVRIEIIDGEEVATKLPSGQFTPVAGIEKYKPEPSLEETTA